MSLRTARGYKVLLWLLTLACLSGAGFLGYKTFFAVGSASRQLKSAETAYAQGLEAYDKKNWNDAATRFDEAKLLAENATQSLKEQAEAGKLPPEEIKSLNEKIMWVKARTIRDQAYAKAQLDGKPLPDAQDQQYKESFRPFALIPDDQARGDAIDALVRAAHQSQNPEIIKEVVRSEIVLGRRDWHIAEPMLRESLKFDAKDPRAHYYLALLEYDQPKPDNMTPTEREKKAGDRVEKAREHLAIAKQNGSPYWRTVGLEAEILDWTVRTAAARKLKPDAVASAEQALEQLLFDPQNGVIAVASRGENLAGFGRADGPGLVSALKIGMDRAVTEARKPGGRTDRVRSVSNATLELSRKTLDDAAMKPFQSDILLTLAQITAAAQPYLAKAGPAAWRDYVADVQTLLTKAGDVIQSLPLVKLELAQISFYDALIAARGGNDAAAGSLVNKAIETAAAGLKAAEENKLSSYKVDQFHMMLADWKLANGAKAEAVEPHIARLRASTLPEAKLRAQFFEAIIAERQGKLSKARNLLQPLAAERAETHRDIARRAHTSLANINMVLGDPAAALASLREVEPIYRKLDELTPIERAWQEALGHGGLDENIAQQIRANLAIAQQIIGRHMKDNPNTPVPGELIEGNLTAARGALKKLRPPSAADRSARLAFVVFNILSNRRNEAETQLAELATDYPDSIDILRARAAMLAAPDSSTAGAPNPNGIAAADMLIRKFLKDYPADKAGRLFYAEWLVGTRRADRAVEYLKDPATFPGGRDAIVDRILGAALLQVGQREEAQKILSSLPHDPTLDTVLIRTAVTREAGEKHLKEALARYENQGQFRIYEAALRLKEGKHEEALKGFSSAIEFTDVSSTAKAGLILTLGSYAKAEPAKARDAAINLSNDLPNEQGLYLAAADAALYLNEIGDPGDKWEQTKTFYAALNMWETVALKNGMPRAEMVITKARARLLAGDPDGAKREAVNALTQNPKHVPTMLLLAELYLMAPADPARAREYYDAAAKEKDAATNPMVPYIDARIKAANGDWAGAAAVYQRLLIESPQTVAPYAPLVAALDAAGQQDIALRTTREWYAKSPDDPRAAIDAIRLLTLSGMKSDAVKFGDEYVTKQVADARKKIADAASQLPKADADKLLDTVRTAAILNTASGFFRAKAFDLAANRAEEVLKTDRTNNPALLLLGDIAIANKEWDKAMAIYRELLNQNRRHFIAGNNVAWILAEQKNDPVSALAVVEEIRKGSGDKLIGPERMPADFLDTIGVVYVKLNRSDRFAEMRTLFEAATKRYPSDPRMFLFLGQAQAALGERSKALESLDTATRLAGAKNGLPDDQNKGVIDKAEAARKKLHS